MEESAVFLYQKRGSLIGSTEEKLKRCALDYGLRQKIAVPDSEADPFSVARTERSEPDF